MRVACEHGYTRTRTIKATATRRGFTMSTSIDGPGPASKLETTSGYRCPGDARPPSRGEHRDCSSRRGQLFGEDCASPVFAAATVGTRALTPATTPAPAACPLPRFWSAPRVTVQPGWPECLDCTRHRPLHIEALQHKALQDLVAPRQHLLRRRSERVGRGRVS